ncbi:hypothetical protein EDC04DRAFT_2710361 [Pisolithus marmoratus]|nr:hypothetical protein EDC04DRAFT_2710361 [Pisolithus marmoratus]
MQGHIHSCSFLHVFCTVPFRGVHGALQYHSEKNLSGWPTWCRGCFILGGTGQRHGANLLIVRGTNKKHQGTEPWELVSKGATSLNHIWIRIESVTSTEHGNTHGPIS